MRTLKLPLVSSLMVTPDPDNRILLDRFQMKLPIISLEQLRLNSEPTVAVLLDGVMITTGIGAVVTGTVGVVISGVVVSKCGVVGIAVARIQKNNITL